MIKNNYVLFNLRGVISSLFHVSPQSDTADKRHEGLAQVVKMGLMPYVSQTSLADQVDIRLEKIHDQIYLPKGDLTIDEILLRRKQLATTYDIRYRLGVRFTFGSIYNNVVNRRL